MEKRENKPKYKSVLDDPVIVAAFDNAMTYEIRDVDGKPNGLAYLHLLQEMPEYLDQAPADLDLRIPRLYASLSFMREIKRAEFIRVQRNRKNKRSEYKHHCYAPPKNGTNPAGKATDSAIDAYIESREDMIQCNEDYDEAEADYKLYEAACEALMMYNQNLKKHLDREDLDERGSRPARRTKPIDLDTSKKEAIETKRNELQELREKIKKQRKANIVKNKVKKKIDPDID